MEMAEKIDGPMLFKCAKKELVKLMDDSGAFRGGSKPYVCTLKRSYGYNKIIGCQSFDNQVVTRLDYDPKKGYHFNFENYTKKQNVCLLIADMTKPQYQRYIDNLTKGRSIEIIPKSPIIRYRKGTNERIYYQFSVFSYLDQEDIDKYVVTKDITDETYEIILGMLVKYSDPEETPFGIDMEEVVDIDGFNDEIIVLDRFFFDYMIQLYLNEIEAKKQPLTRTEILLTKLSNDPDVEGKTMDINKLYELKVKMRQAKKIINKKLYEQDFYYDNDFIDKDENHKKHGR